MALDRMISRKVHALRTKARFELLGNIAGPMLAAAISAWGIAHFQAPVQRIIFGLIILWAIVGLYFLYRGLSTRALPSDAGGRTGLEFYRHEIERRRLLNGRVLLWSLGPLLAAMFVALMQLLTLGHFRDLLPVLSVLMLWVIAFAALGVRKQRELQRDLDDLNDTEILGQGKP